ncbi:MAG: M48 family metallopeptidase [Armatimonadota bacterium]
MAKAFGILVLLSLALCIGFLPASVQAEDIGGILEREYGVIGCDTEDGRIANEVLDRVVGKLCSAVGTTVKSAKVLGGKDKERDKEINAIALPDGRVYVMIGLWNAVKDQPDGEARLAFVVGHEITHIVRKHSRRQMQGSILGSIGGAIIASIFGGSGSAVRTWSQIGSGALQGHYSRKDEYDADRGGLAAMNKAGYPMEAAVAMMEQIRQKYGDNRTPILAWFASHPPTANRVARLKQLIEGIRSGALTPDGFDPKTQKGK